MKMTTSRESPAGLFKLENPYRSPGGLVKIQILIPQPGVGPEILHFQPALRYCCCHWSRNPILRTQDLSGNNLSST